MWLIRKSLWRLSVAILVMASLSFRPQVQAATSKAELRRVVEKYATEHWFAGEQRALFIREKKSPLRNSTIVSVIPVGMFDFPPWILGVHLGAKGFVVHLQPGRDSDRFLEEISRLLKFESISLRDEQAAAQFIDEVLALYSPGRKVSMCRRKENHFRCLAQLNERDPRSARALRLSANGEISSFPY